MKERLALYARVSKTSQKKENQFLRLREWATRFDIEIAGEYVDEISSRDLRPTKEKLLRLLRSGEISGVVFTALDRWARSTSELAIEIDEFAELGVRIVSLREGFDLSTPTGRALARMASVFAELERDLIRERVLDGLDRAKAWGKIQGRHPRECGCGVRDKNGRAHSGTIIPIRNESNEHVGWKFPDGREARIGAFRSPRETPLDNSTTTRARLRRSRKTGV